MDRIDKFSGEFRCHVCSYKWRSIIHDYEYSIKECCRNCGTVCAATYVSDFVKELLNKIDYLKKCIDFYPGMVKTTSRVRCM